MPIHKKAAAPNIRPSIFIMMSYEMSRKKLKFSISESKRIIFVGCFMNFTN